RAAATAAILTTSPWQRTAPALPPRAAAAVARRAGGEGPGTGPAEPAVSAPRRVGVEQAAVDGGAASADVDGPAGAQAAAPAAAAEAGVCPALAPLGEVALERAV